ncbi:MAG: xanthine dehydrogenase accessory protein XdhC [Pseudomonadota bacterium]
MDLDRKALELKDAKVSFCLATVVEVAGSAPRHAGAKMLVTKDESFGTVGGGGLEHRVINDARRAIRHRNSELKQYLLTEEGIQPCGGTVGIFLDVVSTPYSVIVFGAGHIAYDLCPLLAKQGFEVTLVDERKERIELEAFKDLNKLINQLPLDVLPTIEFTDDTHIVCITHRHVHDKDIVRFCLDKPFKYLGLISSTKKWEVFKKHYISEGYTHEHLSRVSTPIGLDIGAETPFEIAVAIIAQIIKLHAKGYFTKERS